MTIRLAGDRFERVSIVVLADVYGKRQERDDKCVTSTEHIDRNVANPSGRPYTYMLRRRMTTAEIALPGRAGSTGWIDAERACNIRYLERCTAIPSGGRQDASRGDDRPDQAPPMDQSSRWSHRTLRNAAIDRFRPRCAETDAVKLSPARSRLRGRLTRSWGACDAPSS